MSLKNGPTLATNAGMSQFAPVAPFTGSYDRRTCIYNLKPYHLRRTRAALGKAMAGTGQANLGFLGDSTTGGVGSGSIGVNDWPARLGSILAAAGFPAAGSGFVWGWKASAADARWGTIPAAWGALSGNSSLITNSTTADPLVFTSTNSATTAAVYYANTGGVFTVSVDGGAATTVTPTGAQSMGTYSVTGLANTTHSLSIVRSSGNVQIFGAEVGTGNGVRIGNAGIGGEKIVAPGSTGWFTQEAILSSSSGFNADLVVLMMETNDAGVTDSVTYKTYVQNVIRIIKANGSDLVLATAVPSSGKDFTQYNRALYELADLNDLPLIDHQDRMGTYTLSNSLGLMSDGLHPTGAGYALVARTVLNALAL